MSDMPPPTGDPIPATPAYQAPAGYPIPAPQAAPRKGLSGGAIVGIVVGIVAGLMVIGILAAIAIPVFLNQKTKAADAAAKADLVGIAVEIEIYALDNQGEPVIAVEDGNYVVNGTVATPVSQGVEYGGLFWVSQDTWCVWVSTSKGDPWEYNSLGGVEPGKCF